MVINEVFEAVVTLYEGHYHFGVAALTNSLIKSGFTGLLCIGYKGGLPSWINQFTKIYDDTFCYNDIITIKFISLDSYMHFGYYKPQFLKDMLFQFPSIQKIYYFDPDIVINAPWSFLSSWVDSGITLCLDSSFPFIHHNHPWRKEWLELSNSVLINHCDYYINSGFIGINRSDIILLDRWIDITFKYKNRGGNVTKFEKDAHRAFKGDQDLLNAVMMVSPDLTFSIIGQEGMGFIQPAYLMSHAVDAVKPWNKNYLIYLFKYGSSPNMADKYYLNFSNSPIKVYNYYVFTMKRFNIKLASILGRIFG